MRASQLLQFVETSVLSLRRPDKTFKDGTLWYGDFKTGSKRHPLTTKQGNKHYYKGTRSSGIGRQNSHGKYIINWDKVRTYVVPASLHTSEIKSMVSPNAAYIRQRYIGYPDNSKSPELALRNAIDYVEYGENYSAVNLEETDYLEEIRRPKGGFTQ